MCVDAGTLQVWNYFLHMLYEEVERLYHRVALGMQEIHTVPAVWRTVG